MLEIMPETNDQTLVAKASDMLTTKDYKNLFIPELDNRLLKFGKIKAVIFFDENFKGWQPGAAWDDFVYGVQHRHDFEKIAIVTDKKWLEWASRLIACFMDGQAEIYEPDKFEQAIIWVEQ